MLEKYCDREIRAKKMDDGQKQDLMLRVSYSSMIQSISDSDLMIEAVSEDFELKKSIF